jgi:hypothetical protein
MMINPDSTDSRHGSAGLIEVLRNILMNVFCHKRVLFFSR